MHVVLLYQYKFFFPGVTFSPYIQVVEIWTTKEDREGRKQVKQTKHERVMRCRLRSQRRMMR